MKKQLFTRRIIQRSLRVVGLFAILFAAGLSSSRAQNTWTQKTDFGGTGRGNATGFFIAGKEYIGTGQGANFNDTNDFWEYDPVTDVSTQKSNFGGVPRDAARGFSIGSKGYIGTGYNGSGLKDFWEYDPATNTWTQKADFGGGYRYNAVGFSIDNKGYIGTGGNPTLYNDFWEYDPGTDVWTKKADFGGAARSAAVGFSIGSKGYVGTGWPGNYKDFWEYDPATNAWTQKANFGGTGRNAAVGFSIGSKGYIGTGNDNTYKNDFWEYDPATNTWIQKADFGGTVRYNVVGFSIDSKGYIGTGMSGTYPYYTYHNDFWEYTPDTSSCTTPTATITPLGYLDICTTGFVKLQAPSGSGYTYQWNRNNVDMPGQIYQTLKAKKTGNYRVRISTGPGCIAVSKKVTVYTSCKLDEEQSDALALEMKLYPNPTNGEFVIAITLLEEVNTPATIQVINTLGQTVYDETTSVMNGVLQEEIQLSEAADGMYLVKVIINDHVFASQISLQK